jgi:hypothetical protein
MSLSTYAPTLLVQVRDSARLRTVLSLLQVVACAALLGLWPSMRSASVWCAVLVFALAWRADGRRTTAVRWLTMSGGGVITTIDSIGGAERAMLETGSIVLPGLVVLAVRNARGARRRIVLPDDGLCADDARRLRARVRLAA